MHTKTWHRVAGLCAVLAALCAASSFTHTAPHAAARTAAAPAAPAEFNLRDFGAFGDGFFDDGPALQRALDALAAAGGGTLNVPAGRYVIGTPVSKDFTGLASSVSIVGVPSDTPVDTTVGGFQLSQGLDLTTEFLPRTLETGIALNLKGLQSLLLQDLAFAGTPGVKTDALVTVSVSQIDSAVIRHCEFNNVSSIVRGGAIIRAVRSHLHLEQSKILGSGTNSAYTASAVENFEWKGVSVSDTVFLDYGARPGLFSKTHLAAPYSWVNVANAAAVTADSPRREVVIRTVLLDEGGFIGLTSRPFNHALPTAPIDLYYITGLRINVTNVGPAGHYLDGLKNVLVENSRYGWSTRRETAIHVLKVGNTIIDRIHTEAAPTRLRADGTAGRVTVINSVYQDLASLAQETRVINTATDADDPVWYVRQQFQTLLNRAPDPAGHLYWSDQILRCGEADAACVEERRAALNAYLATAPAQTFAIRGRVTDDGGAGVAGAAVTLAGSQSVKTFTDPAGNYRFLNLPTSGVYTVSAAHTQFTSATPAQTFVTPEGDRTADFTGTPKRYTVAGRLLDAAGQPLATTGVALSGSQSGATTTDANGNYSFPNLTGGGSLTVTPARFGFGFTPATRTFIGLAANQTANFTGTPTTHTIGGRVTTGGVGVAGVTLTLSGSRAGTATTNANGDYAFAGLPAGGSYTVTATPNSAVVTPSARALLNLAANQTADFAWAPFVNHARASNGATALASTHLDLGRAPLAAINGDRRGLHWGLSPSTGSGWHDATLDASPDWLEVQFPGRREIHEVSVFSVQDKFTTPAIPTTSMTFTKYGLTDFRVEYWTGTAWAAVPEGVIAGNNRVWRKLTFAPLTTTKLRVFVDGGLGGYARLVEIEAWGPAATVAGVPPRINHASAAQGADVTASSTNGPGHHPFSAINGDRRALHWGTDPLTGSGWMDSTANVYPDWLEITFSGPKKITEVSVIGVQDDLNAPAVATTLLVSNVHALVDFRAQYWDGAAWVDLPNAMTNNNKVWRRIIFPAVTTTKVRVLVTQALSGSTCIAEVEVY